MTRLLYIYIIGVLALVAAMLASCGSAEKSERRGDAALALGEYAEAAGQYKRAYTQAPPKQKPLRGRIALKMARAYAHYGNTARAVGSYRNALRYHAADSTATLELARALLKQGDTRAAEKLLLACADTMPHSSAVQQALSNCRLVPGLLRGTSAYEVKAATWLTGSRSDFCPAWVDDAGGLLYFTSTRPQASGDISLITATKNGDIFVSKKDERGQWKAPEPVEGELNTDFDEGACVLTADGKTMYLTVCRTDPQYPRMAEIWQASRSDAKWGKPTQLKLTADTLSSYAHPALSPDGKWLYFTSDLPGGQGGLDLWRIEMGGNHGFGRLENLGPDINTPGDECFPAFRPSGELYFSSDGRTPCLGGLDLYRAELDTLTDRWTVHHLPVPMNSCADDFGITFEGLHNRGYFSSGRSTGGRGWDRIYSFSYPEVLQTVKGWVYEQDGYELPAAEVYMVGSDGTNEKFGVLSDGSFEKPLEPGVSYLFLATCKGYLNVRAELQADSVPTEKQHVLQFPLPSVSVPVLVRNVFYAFDSAELSEASCEALDRLARMLHENPHITIELAAHCDQRGNDDYNLRLSQRRAESVVKYLTAQGIEPDRLTPRGYGEQVPKTVNKRLTETHPFLHEGDSLTEAYIAKLPPEQQEVCHGLNRRTEFRVLRTTYGLFDEHGKLKPEALGGQASSLPKP